MGLSIADELALAEAHLADSHKALTAARLAIQLGQGDNQVTRAGVDQLTAQIQFWRREVQRLEDQSVGASGMMTATWRC
jgi:hypothetical protein